MVTYIWCSGKSWRRIFYPWSTLHLKAICHRYFLLVCMADCFFVCLFELDVFCLCVILDATIKIYIYFLKFLLPSSMGILVWFYRGFFTVSICLRSQNKIMGMGPPLYGKNSHKSSFLWERPFSCVAVFVNIIRCLLKEISLLVLGSNGCCVCGSCHPWLPLRWGERAP